jgi:hypothetical protein
MASSEVVLESFARADLRPAARRASIPFTRPPELIGIWPGPHGRVAVGAMEVTASGATIREPPRGARNPSPRDSEPRFTSTFRLWTPASGATGPATPVGAVSMPAVGWLGDTFVLVQGAQTAVDPTRGSTLVAPGRVRAFRVVP